MKGKIYINWESHEIISTQKEYDKVRRRLYEETAKNYTFDKFLGEHYSPIEIFGTSMVGKAEMTRMYYSYIQDIVCKTFSELFQPYEGMVIEEIKTW